MSYASVPISSRNWSLSPTVGGRGSGTDIGSTLGSLTSLGGGIAGIIASLFGPSEEELAAGRSRERAASASSDYNQSMASAFSLDPHQFMSNFMRGQMTADAIGGNPATGGQGVQFWRGEGKPTENLLSSSPGLGGILEALRSPSTYGMQTDGSGQITGWRPQSFQPTTLNDQGKPVNAGQQTYGALPQQPQVQPRFQNPGEMFRHRG